MLNYVIPGNPKNKRVNLIVKALIEGTDLPPNQVGNQPNELEIDKQLKIGSNDPIKEFIDKLIDTKNKIFSEESRAEISNLVQ